MPLVSVVMAVRDGEDYLREAVDSILGQTLEDFELVVVDDGSTDATGEILASYPDDRLRVLTQPRRGVAASLNTGIRSARADLIARMDADDASEPTRLERQVAFMLAHADHVLAGTDVHVISEDGSYLYEAQLVTDDAAIRGCLDQLVAPFYHGSVMFRRDAVVACGLYDERIPQQVEDMLLWLRLRRLGAMANIPVPLYRYRLRPGSLSRLPRGLAEAKARVIRNYAATMTVNPADVQALTEPTSPASGRERRASFELDLGKVYLDQAGDVQRARRHLARAVALAPMSARAWFNLGLSLSPSRLRALRIRKRNHRVHLRAGACR